MIDGKNGTCPIHNGDTFEFAGFEWVALDAREFSVLAIMRNIWCVEQFDRNGCNDYNYSSMRRKVLELLPTLGEENLLFHTSYTTSYNGSSEYKKVRDKVFILTLSECIVYSEFMPIFETDVWTMTPFYCVDLPINIVVSRWYEDGMFRNTKQSAGVVPACKIDISRVDILLT